MTHCVNLNSPFLDWKLLHEGKSIPATVPGQVQTDLMAAGLLQDPYYRYNDTAYAFFGRS